MWALEIFPNFCSSEVLWRSRGCGDYFNMSESSECKWKFPHNIFRIWVQRTKYNVICDVIRSAKRYLIVEQIS